MRTMNDLSLHFLQDVYDAERRALRAMQKMVRAASGEALKQALTQHRSQSEQQVTRLEQVFEHVTGKRPRGKSCAAMIGLLQEVDEAIEAGEKGPVLDAALIACAQVVDHYEIARYGAMVAWAHQAGHDDVAALLQANLDEEKRSDAALNELATGQTNAQAAAVPGPDDDAAASAAQAPAPRRRGRPPGSGKKTNAPAQAKPQSKAASAEPAAKPAAAKPQAAKPQAAKPSPAKSISARGRTASTTTARGGRRTGPRAR